MCDFMIGWPTLLKCPVACLFLDESQQPTLPQMHPLVTHLDASEALIRRSRGRIQIDLDQMLKGIGHRYPPEVFGPLQS